MQKLAEGRRLPRRRQRHRRASGLADRLPGQGRDALHRLLGAGGLRGRGDAGLARQLFGAQGAGGDRRRRPLHRRRQRRGLGGQRQRARPRTSRSSSSSTCSRPRSTTSTSPASAASRRDAERARPGQEPEGPGNGRAGWTPTAPTTSCSAPAAGTPSSNVCQSILDGSIEPAAGAAQIQADVMATRAKAANRAPSPGRRRSRASPARLRQRSCRRLRPAIGRVRISEVRSAP